MANKKDLKQQEKQQEELVEQRISSVERFFEENKKIIWGCAIAAVVIGLGVLAYHKFYLQPLKAEAQAQMFPAEASFRNGEWELALKGDGNTLGFEQIIEDYGGKAGNSTWMYAGICELQLGNYEQALSYLKKYKGSDKMMTAKAISLQGDALTGLEKYKEALACYMKAASVIDNPFTAGYLLKAGVVNEELGDKAAALDCYKKIKDQYPQSMEAYDIDKYIGRIEE